MRYSEIFKEIVDITHNDYAGWDEKKGWDQPEVYIEKIDNMNKNGKLNPQTFVDLVRDYLDDFQDPHMFFRLDGAEAKEKTCGFKVRRYQDALYVTETTSERRFPVSTKIVAIDGIDIETSSENNPNIHREASHERQSWNTVMNRASTIGIVKENGEIETLHVQSYDLDSRESTYSINSLDENTLLLTFSDFANLKVIDNLIKENEGRLETCKKLIVDVRNNSGGNANSFTRLLPYIFPKGEKPKSDLPIREFNSTENNVRLLNDLIQEVIIVTEDEATVNMFHDTLNQFKLACRQGFVRIDFSKHVTEASSNFEGKDKAPEQVIVLSDYMCGSAGDEFVETCKESSKVTVIGRATMGVTDYSDLVIRQWNEKFYLYYPISRLKTKTKVDPLHGKGVQPDMYVPWTPEHIKEDIDLRLAVDLVQV